ncbi:MAG: DMT family transporter [Panacagrimonas sp.]
MVYVLLIVAIAFEVAGTLLLDTAANAPAMATKWALVAGSVACYAVGLGLFLFVLKTMSVGLAYAIWAGVGIALVCVASVLLDKQQLDVAAGLGIGFIIIGVFIITRISGVTLK